MSTKLFKGRHMHQTVNNSNSRKTEWTVWLGQGAFWDLRLLNVNTDSLSTQCSLKHNKHATALISTVIVNQEISQKMKNEKKKIKSAAMLTFQELHLFPFFKKKKQHWIIRPEKWKWNGPNRLILKNFWLMSLIDGWDVSMLTWHNLSGWRKRKRYLFTVHLFYIYTWKTWQDSIHTIKAYLSCKLTLKLTWNSSLQICDTYV